MSKFKGGILGFDTGIMLAPMGPDVSGPELVAAVANAGGVALLASPFGYDITVKVIRQTKKLTKKRFGAGILLEFDDTDTVKAIVDEKLACLQVFWGDFPKEMVDEAHKNGLKVIHQIGTIKEAEKCVAAGVDCIVVQGVEAGGHIRGEVGLIALLPRVLDVVGDRKDIAVVAAGSITDARGYAAALAMGAQGVAVGTRFIATKESFAHEYYKQQLLKYTEFQTDRTDLYGRASWRAFVRCLNTPFNAYWRKSPDFDTLVNDDSQPIIGRSVIYGGETIYRRFAGQVPNPTFVGKIEETCLLAGQGVGLVKDIIPTAKVVELYIKGVTEIIEKLKKTYIVNSSDATDDTRPDDPLSATQTNEINNVAGSRWNWRETLCF